MQRVRERLHALNQTRRAPRGSVFWAWLLDLGR
jgi:hypothetical protein